MQRLLGTSYLPGRIYFQQLLNADSAEICGGTPWQKQSLRNRTYILSPNGVQRLVVPVLHSGPEKLSDGEIKIDYRSPWIREHKGALEAAYNTSPFFDFLRDELFAIYDDQPEYLFDLNIRLLQLLLKKSKVQVSIRSSPQTAASLNNLLNINRKEMPDDSHLISYLQVFDYKSGFTPGLSALDIIANTGTI